MTRSCQYAWKLLHLEMYTRHPPLRAPGPAPRAVTNRNTHTKHTRLKGAGRGARRQNVQNNIARARAARRAAAGGENRNIL